MGLHKNYLLNNAAKQLCLDQFILEEGRLNIP